MVERTSRQGGGDAIHSFIHSFLHSFILIHLLSLLLFALKSDGGGARWGTMWFSTVREGAFGVPCVPFSLEG